MNFQEPYNRSTFVIFLSDKFLPEDFTRDTKEIDYSISTNFATSIFRLGECKSLGLEVFEIHHSSVNDARVGIAKDAFQMLLHHSFCNRALIAFVPEKGKQWRFSLIQIEAEINNNTNRIKHGYSNPRRYSYLLGDGALIKTPMLFLIEKGRVRQRTEGSKSLTPLEDLVHRFSIEALTKDFYGKLYNWFLWAIDKRTKVCFPVHLDPAQNKYENKQIKIIRLITRMLFVWFIKQKHLVPSNLFDTDFLKSVLKNFDPTSTEDGNYYNAILQNLFFATLNQEIESRTLFTTAKGVSSYYGNKQLYRDTDSSYFTFPMEDRKQRILDLFKDIPYLNGGLFECLDQYDVFSVEGDNNKLKQITNFDGFSHQPRKRANIPNVLFFAQEHMETVDNGGQSQTISVMGLIELFKQYNFTVEENITSDKEVSLNPELLGRVFENLLAAYNPETQESARKSTGSFYTPREIVDYMVEESLIDYLSDKCPNDESSIRRLVKEGEVDYICNPEKIISDLKKIKILDPACGSGAFPMGILLKITNIIEVLTPAENFNRYETKLEIIKNCIYGIDIQPIAMMICKLRFFISLICDCEKDGTKSNFGIEPLPNLETRFVAANSLLSAKVKGYDQDWTQDEHLKQLQQELLNLRLDIFDKRTHKAKINNKIADCKKCIEIADYIRQKTTKPDEQKIANLKATIAQCEAELPKYDQDYWIDETSVQQSLFEDKKKTIFKRNPNKEKREKLQELIQNCKNDIRKEQNKLTLTGFEEAVEQVSLWNPYNQNAVSPFFDPEWMFGVADGFDIIIGNPPYIQLQNNGGELAKLYESCGYSTFARTGDIYCLFYERGWQLLKKNGYLCYITSNKWMRAGYGEKTREFFANKTNPLLLIDFAGVKIFESATVDTNILLFAKSDNQHKTICAVTNKQNKDSIRNLSDFVQQQNVICSFGSSESWVVLSPIEQSIKRKIEAVGTPLKDWNIQINYGIKTGFNDAFIISTEKREEILANCQTEDERKRTDELIRPILRGRDIKRYGYVDNGLFLINTHNGIRDKLPRIDINDYPAVKAHLDQYWDRIATRADKGDTPYNLRNCAYLDLFFQPHICWKAVGRNLAFALVESGMFLTAPASFISGGKHNETILHYLCSNVGTYFIYKNSDTTGAGDIMLNIQSLIKFPIPVGELEIKGLSYREINEVIYTSYGFTNAEVEYIESQI